MGAGRHEHPSTQWDLHVLATVLIAGSFLVSTQVHVAGAGFAVARSLHVVGLVLAFGPVLLLDWYGLAWLTRRRRFEEVRRLADATDPLVWLGLVLLAGSGIFLAPELSRPMTLAKVAFVLIVVNNGVAVRGLAGRLRLVGNPLGLGDLPPTLRRRVIASVVVSQTAWWGAAVIGLVTTATRGS
ncbi:conserved membrane hypothetical protein [Nostocoides japonicum T1-X7]|uniref:Copper resistance protein D domain-containing protein n=1 Tax=Nostocoides japonicum T1-X7 TaxID=1194083 RepID=A0A077M5Z5_9MICO|nr:hypothetical protein [Tetrasphaera japonica]CCH79460.1 conserved membrane hypothetical protein [Tetrasphaera japonica T1-X7]